MKNTAQFLCSILLLSAKLTAQVVYTDLNPDTIVSATIQNPSVQYNLDLNNDGTIDFNIRHNNYEGFIQTEFYTNFGELGQIVTNGTGAPAALNINDNINSGQPNWVCTVGSSSNSALFMNANGANFVGQPDKFIGLKIKLSNQWHYGWVSLSIPSDTSKIIVKAYAYNQVPNASISAGQTTTGINDPYSEEKNIISVFPNPFNFSATIQFHSVKDNVEIDLYNLYGQKIKTMNCLSEDKITIERGNLNTGLYFYELKQNTKSLATGKLIIVD